MPTTLARGPSFLARHGEALLDHADRTLQSAAARLALSFLIVVSVLPPSVLHPALPPGLVGRLDLLFLALFGPEFLLRLAGWIRRRRLAQTRPGEGTLLVADLLALLTFLPVAALPADVVWLRLLRLTRLVLLVGYWGDMLVDLWAILVGRERRTQVVFVLLFGLVVTFAGAVVLVEDAPEQDFNADGAVDARDRSFGHVLWWGLRQVHDPGNIVDSPADAVVALVSLVLTFSGLVLFSFLVGISASVIDELVHRSRERPVALREHTAILGLGPYTHLLLDELADIYRKNRKRPRVAVLGSQPEAPEWFFARHLRGFHYRAGDPVRAADLDRVDVGRAKRVLVTSPHGHAPDSAAIGAILAVRTRTASARLYADLAHEKNFLAARAAGGARTQVVGSGSFLGSFVAQALIYPGVHRAYREILTTSGSEIYTYLFDPGELRRFAAPEGALCFRALANRARDRFRTALLGFFTGPGTASWCDVEELELVMNPASPATRARHPRAFDEGGDIRRQAVRGFVGLSLCWDDVRAFSRGLLRPGAGGSVTAPRPAAPGPAPSLRFPSPLRRVLVCGGSLRVPRVVSELAEYYGRLDVTCLVRERAHLEDLAQGVRAALGGYLSGVPTAVPSWTLHDEVDGLRAEGPRGEVRVRLLAADWSDASVLLRNPAVDLPATDAVVFLPRDEGDAADGMVALDCLRLAQFAAAEVVALRPGLRVVGVLRDPVKSDLLESRLDQMAGPSGDERFTVASSERLRHLFTVQNLFVAGLNAVLLELLGASGQHLCRVGVTGAGGRQPPGAFDPLAAGAELLDRGLLLLGADLAEDSRASRVALGPVEMPPGPVPWSSVRALYLVGDGQGLRQAPGEGEGP